MIFELEWYCLVHGYQHAAIECVWFACEDNTNSVTVSPAFNVVFTVTDSTVGEKLIHIFVVFDVIIHCLESVLVMTLRIEATFG